MSCKTKVLLIMVLISTLTNAQNISWEKSLSIPYSQSILGIALCDSGYLCIGKGDHLVNSFAELTKFDTSGNLLWRKPLFGDTNIISTVTAIESIPNDENYIVTGSKFGASQDYIIKIDANGNIVWEEYFDYTGLHLSVKTLLVLKDKSIITAGFNQYSATNWDVIAKRLDSLGNLMWEKNYPVAGSQEAFDIIEMLDGSIIIVGSSTGDNLIMRIGFDGRFIDDTIVNSIISDIDHQFAALMPENKIYIINDAWNGNWYQSQYLFLDQNLNLISTSSGNDWLRSSFQVLKDTSIYLTRAPDIDSMVASKSYTSGIFTNSLLISYQNPRVSVFDQINIGREMILVGSQLNNSDDYWIANIDSVGEAWIPDHCAFSPPVANFRFSYSYPLLTLVDSSYSGLKYLDTIYSWQWNTSAGQGGTTDSITIFYDSTVNNTIDIELVIGNWYGCTDTIQKTLEFNPNGISETKDLDVNIYPNPTSRIVNFNFNKNIQRTIKIYDVNGQIKFENNSKNRIQRIDLKHLNPGIYIYNISGNSFFQVGKLILVN